MLFHSAQPRWSVFVPLRWPAAIAGLAACTRPAAAAAAARAGGAARRRSPAIPWTSDQPAFLRLPNIAARPDPRAGGGDPAVRQQHRRDPALAAAMLKAAELALFDARQPNIVLMTADEGSDAGRRGRGGAASFWPRARKSSSGPLFGPSVTAVAPIARDRGVPVLAFSTEKQRGGQRRLSPVLPAAERSAARGGLCRRAKATTTSRPWCRRTPYGNVIADAFTDAVKSAGATIGGRRAFHAHYQCGDGAVRGHGQDQCRCGDDRARRRRSARHRAHRWASTASTATR